MSHLSGISGEECALFLKRGRSFPLAGAGKIALYGNGARMTRIGGTGSGEMNVEHIVSVEEALTNAGFQITTEEWLDRYTIEYEKAKKRFHNSLRREAAKQVKLAVMISMGRYMTEPEYEIPMETDADVDTAVYVLARECGEGADRTFAPGDIALSESEVRDILWCNSHFKNFCLVLNTGGMVDLSKVWQVSDILLLSQLGTETGTVLAGILLGRVNPSGKLTATWAAPEQYPFSECFGQKDDTEYREGIYVGYRYFDRTDRKIIAPFGFGLSYTEFELAESSFSQFPGGVQVLTEVTNSGKFSGKEVVQVYVSVPEGRLDQPEKMLAAFAKTGLMEPGERQTVIMNFFWKNIASYDEEKECYLLEKGTYGLRVGNSSANTALIGEIVLDEDVEVKKAERIFPAPDFRDFVPDKCEVRAEGRFPQEDSGRSSIRSERLTNRDRIGENGATDPGKRDLYQEARRKAESLTDEELMGLTMGAFDHGKPFSGAVGNSGIHVAGAAGETKGDVCPAIVMADGPAGLRLAPEFVRDSNGGAHSVRNNLPGNIREFLPGIAKWYLNRFFFRSRPGQEVLTQNPTALPIGTAIAQSFNPEFAQRLGEMVGREMEQYGVHLWLAPALNIQRDVRCGRNFEYFSEDPLVSGIMAGALTRGVQSRKGRGVTIKHFLCNNQEKNRLQNNSIVSERALREIYLRGFEIAMETEMPAAVMTSYNLVNGEHTSESSAVNRTLLRGQMGYEGLIMTDWLIPGYRTEHNCRYPVSHAERVLSTGGDLLMPGSAGDYRAVRKALKKGRISRESLVERAARVIMTSEYLSND